MSKPEPSPRVAWPRTKIVGAFVVGALITLSSQSDAELLSFFGPAFGSHVRLPVAVFLGGFYALEKYLSKVGEWWKRDGETPPPGGG